MANTNAYRLNYKCATLKNEMKKWEEERKRGKCFRVVSRIHSNVFHVTLHSRVTYPNCVWETKKRFVFSFLPLSRIHDAVSRQLYDGVTVLEREETLPLVLFYCPYIKEKLSWMFRKTSHTRQWRKFIVRWPTIHRNAATEKYSTDFQIILYTMRNWGSLSTR